MNNMVKFLRENAFLLVGICIIIGAYCLSAHITPSISYAAIEGKMPYPWFMWVISCSLLAIPLVGFILSSEFKQGHWEEKTLWLAITMLAISTMHRPRLFIDIQILLFAATALFAIFHKPFCFNKLRSIDYFLLAYLAWNILSLSWSQCPSYGGKMLNRFVPLLVYPLCFHLIHLNRETLNRILLAFWQAAIIATLMSMASLIYEMRFLDLPISELLTMQKHGYYNADYSQFHQAYQMAFAWSGTEHPTYNAIWIIAAAMLSFYLYKEKTLSAFSAIVGTTLMVFLMALIQSRIGIIMSLITIVCGIYYLVPNKKLCLGIYGICAVGVTCLLYLHPSILTYVQDPPRAYIFDINYEYVSQKPWLGTGIGGMTAEHMASIVPDYPSERYAHWNPHNQFLGDWIQTGIIGFLLIVGLTLSALVCAIRDKKFLAFVFVLCMAFLSCIEMPFQVIIGTTLISLYTCLFLCPTDQMRDKNAGKTPCDLPN